MIRFANVFKKIANTCVKFAGPQIMLKQWDDVIQLLINTKLLVMYVSANCMLYNQYEIDCKIDSVGVRRPTDS